jgi:hypothetical protein
MVPHPLTPRLSSWPRSTALSANINYSTACLFSYIINKHWKYWCGMVWVGSRCPHVSTANKDKNNENDSGMPSPWIPLAIATNIHCQAAGRRCAWSYDNLGAKTSRSIKASCPAFELFELQALGHSRSIYNWKTTRFCMCVQFFFVRSLRMLQVEAPSRKKTVLKGFWNGRQVVRHNETISIQYMFCF